MDLRHRSLTVDVPSRWHDPRPSRLAITGDTTLVSVRRLVIALDKITRPGGRPRKEDRRRSGWGSDAGSTRSRKGKGGPYQLALARQHLGRLVR
jgi:hypothetical protein